MDGLPGDARAAFVLRDIQGLTYEHIAETLDISLSAVKSRIFRARRALADGLSAYDQVGGGT
jgi:RNA polymerase sigma-70 factor (ECF subfamily)